MKYYLLTVYLPHGARQQRLHLSRPHRRGETLPIVQGGNVIETIYGDLYSLPGILWN